MTTQTIAVRYRINILQFLFITLVIIGFSCALLMAAHRQILQTEPADPLGMIYVFLATTFGISIATLLVMRDREKMRWSLSEHELLGGTRHPVRIPIASIASISEGVPARTRIGANNPWLKSGIVLTTTDHKILALNLATSADGARLMHALLQRCSAVFTAAPAFSASELAILQRLRWNTVIDTASGRPV